MSGMTHLNAELGGFLYETQDAYVCVNLDWWPANKCNWGRCPWANASVLSADLRHPRLRNALAALAPLHLRVGGTLQDSISYAMRDDEPCPPFRPAPPTQSESFTGGCLRRAGWDRILELCEATGSDLIFGLNALSGRADAIAAKEAAMSAACSRLHSTVDAHDEPRGGRRDRPERRRRRGRASQTQRGGAKAEGVAPEPAMSRLQRRLCRRFGERKWMLAHAAQHDALTRWDPTQTHALLAYAAERQRRRQRRGVGGSRPTLYAVAYGNELGLTAEAYTAGLAQLAAVVRRLWPAAEKGTCCGGNEEKAAMMAPKIVATDSRRWQPRLVAQLLARLAAAGESEGARGGGGGGLHALTWHLYPLGASYGNAGMESGEALMRPADHDAFAALAASAHRLVAAANVAPAASVSATASAGSAISSTNLTASLTSGGSMRRRPPELWMGESGGAFNSGADGVSNSFAHGFWYAQSLAALAAAGHTVFCRQTLVGGHYSLLDQRNALQPNPDYYVALLFRRLMGSRVLSVRRARRHDGANAAALTNGSSASLERIYAHCAPAHGATRPPQQWRRGAVTLLILNYAPKRPLELDGVLGAAALSPRLEYHLTAPSLRSRVVELNGATLRVGDDDAIPPMTPRRVDDPAAPLCVAPRSFAFVVLTEAAAAACIV